MKLPLLATALAGLCLTLSPRAQDVQVFGGTSTRACSTMVLFGKDLMAGLTITHGQPVWKDEYTGMLDRLKGKTHRLGKDLWTTFLTSVDVELGGTRIPAGSYCVGLHCDAKGAFSLALIDSGKAMKQGLLPFGPQNWKPDALVPLKLSKDVADESIAKMTITLTSDKEAPTKGSLTLAWGPHTLSAPLQIVTKPAPAGGK